MRCGYDVGMGVLCMFGVLICVCIIVVVSAINMAYVWQVLVFIGMWFGVLVGC